MQKKKVEKKEEKAIKDENKIENSGVIQRKGILLLNWKIAKVKFWGKRTPDLRKTFYVFGLPWNNTAKERNNKNKWIWHPAIIVAWRRGNRCIRLREMEILCIWRWVTKHRAVRKINCEEHQRLWWSEPWNCEKVSVFCLVNSQRKTCVWWVLNHETEKR